MKYLTPLFFTILFSAQTFNAQEALDFTFTDIQGEEHGLFHALDQDFIVLLDFFFADCPPCQEIAPDLVDLADELEGKNVLIWSISDRDSDSAVDGFKSEFGLENIACGIDGGGQLATNLYAANFIFTGWPTFAVICPDKSIDWNIAPVTNGLPEIIEALELCGMMDIDPNDAYVSLSATNDEDLLLNQDRLTLSPNPIGSIANIQVGLSESSIIALEVFSILGKKLMTIDTGDSIKPSGFHDFSIPDGKLLPGTYLVRLTIDGNKTLTRKLIKQ